MRPIYEQPADRIRQREVIDAFCAAYGCESTERVALCAWDYDLSYRGSRVALAEVKVRRNPIGAYPTYLISSRKVSDLIVEAERRAVAPLLVVQWSDGRGWCRPDRVGYALGTGGRFDRGDPADVESVALIDIARFHRF